MALTGEQRNNIKLALRVANRRGATPRQKKALIEAMGVESNFRDVPYGDRDSEGILQQRPSQGWGPAGESLRTDVRQFLRAARRANASGSAGALAQAVQRSAFPGRYDALSGRADRILNRFDRGGSQMASEPSAALEPGSAGASMLPALVASLQKPQRPTSSAPPTPAFSARASLPMAGATPVSEAPVAKQDTLTQTLAALTTAGQSLPGIQANGTPGGSTSSGGSVKGRVKVAPGANRPGVPINRQVVSFVRQVAGIYGKPLTIGTGSNHSRLTVNGNVSDHWDGNGADIPLSGRALVRAGQAALIAAGMSEKRARRQTGGGFTVGGFQIIFNTNAPGWGDHTDHLHVGRSH